MPKAKDERKQGIIRTATLRLVVQTGFTGLKMADVAKAAGLATGTVYIYYEDKGTLINDLYQVTKAEVASVLLDPAHRALDFKATFRNMWMAYFAFCRQYPEKMLFVEQFLYSGFIAAAVITDTERLLEPLDQFLIQGQAQGLIRPMDVHLMKAYMQGALHEMVKVLDKHDRQLTDHERETCFEMTWKSLEN
jgi:AcrR family transcriptional regulator